MKLFAVLLVLAVGIATLTINAIYFAPQFENMIESMLPNKSSESDRSPQGGDFAEGSIHESAVDEVHSPNLRSRTPTEAPDHD